MNTQNSTADRGHHPCSASTLEVLKVSPAFMRDPEADTTAAERGTYLHSLVALDPALDPPNLSDADAAALAWVRAIRQRYLRRRGKVYEEIYVQVDDEGVLDDEGHLWPGTSGGYLDFAWLSPNQTRAVVLDYKFGAWSVTAARHNVQGKVYALGIFHRFPTVQRVMVAFLQAAHRRVSVAHFRREQVPGLLLEITQIVARALVVRRKKAWHLCSPSLYCTFCRHAAQCPRLWKLTRQFGIDYASAKVPRGDLAQLLSDPKAAGQLLDTIALITRQCDSLKRTLTQAVIDSEGEWCPEGWRLRSRDSWEWADTAQVEAFLGARVPPEVLAKARSYQLTPLLDYVAEVAPRGKKTEAREEFRLQLQAAGVLRQGRPVVFLEKIR